MRVRIRPGSRLFALRDHGDASATGFGPTPAHWAPGTRLNGPDITSGVESTDWSGQIDVGTGFTGISAQWIVPSVKPSAGDEYSATWIGIDGATSTSLIQVGTSQDSGDGTTAYAAWYEILPGPEMVQPQPVAPGDLMSASIAKQAPGEWQIIIEDITGKWTEMGNYSYDGTGTSAEWIEEAPTVDNTQSTLADFGTVEFTSVSVSDPELGFPLDLIPVSMVDADLVVIAYPGSYTESADSIGVTFGTPPPVVDSVSPSDGSTNGGTTVTIEGDYLTGASSVSFGGEDAFFTVNPDASLTAAAPAEPAGSVDVTVTTPGGTSARTAADEFSYVSPEPGSPPPTPPTPPPAVTQGYDVAAADGGVFNFGTAQYDGSMGGTDLNAPVVGMAGDIGTGGYWEVASDGGVFSFDAPYYGSMGGTRLDAPIVGMVADNLTGGYWMVAADGGVFSFNAPYYGSMGGTRLDAPIVGMAATPFGTGYWLVAKDGGVFAFGDASFSGSMGGTALDAPVVGMAADFATGGYWLVAKDGGVFAFDAPFYGSMGGSALDGPIVGMAATLGSGGYWFVGSDGGVFNFGDAEFDGSMGGTALDAPVVGMAGIL